MASSNCCESKAICSYIDAAFPGPPLIPRESAAMAKTEQWISCVNATIDPLLVRHYILGYAFPGTPDGGPDRKRIDAALVNMPAQFAVLEKAVASGHLVGNSFTLADIKSGTDRLLPDEVSRERRDDGQVAGPDALSRAAHEAGERAGLGAASRERRSMSTSVVARRTLRAIPERCVRAEFRAR